MLGHFPPTESPHARRLSLSSGGAGRRCALVALSFGQTMSLCTVALGVATFSPPLMDQANGHRHVQVHNSNAGGHLCLEDKGRGVGTPPPISTRQPPPESPPFGGAAGCLSAGAGILYGRPTRVPSATLFLAGRALSWGTLRCRLPCAHASPRGAAGREGHVACAAQLSDSISGRAALCPCCSVLVRHVSGRHSVSE